MDLAQLEIRQQICGRPGQYALLSKYQARNFLLIKNPNQPKTNKQKAIKEKQTKV